MSPTAITKVTEKKKQMTAATKRNMIRAGGSLKTKNVIDAQEILREVRGK